jgi:cbb3-type cytochrome oxidase subunit 3
MPTIDHDPNERPRQMRGEAVFVAVASAITLLGSGFALKWVDRSYGTAAFVVVCGLFITCCFVLAFRLEAKERRNRQLQRSILGLRPDQ